jgi:hypothetical protein
MTTRAQIKAASREAVPAEPRSLLGGCIVPIVCCLVFVAVGLVAAPRFYTWWWGLDAQSPASADQPLGTAPAFTPRPLPTDDYGVGAYNATQEARSDAPTPTGPPVPPPPTVPTPTWAFWSDADLAAFTATAEAFYKPELIPTAPPAFVDATLAACADPALVEQSPALQLWCPSAMQQEGGE